MSRTHWDTSQMPALRERVAVVTGANSGLGWQISLQLAKRGAHVVMACRDAGKASQAARAIQERVPDASLSYERLDLSSLASVRTCASAILQHYKRLDLLVNNAGVMFLPYERSVDGFEIQMASNHLGHFLLTGLLLERLAQTCDARVVTMSSGFGRFGSLPTRDLQGYKHRSRYLAYCDSKLANLVFARELSQRLAHRGVGIMSLAAHPGYSATNLQFGAANKMRSPILAGVNRLTMRFSNAALAQPAHMGALPALYAATCESACNGDYIGPDGWMEMRGYPTRARIQKQALNRQEVSRFWDLSEESARFRY